MGQEDLKTALPTMGALYVTISFSVFEIKNKTFISDGNTQFDFNVRKNRHLLLRNAIYNAIKREFPNRTVTAYNINILNYTYSYYLVDYEITEKNGEKYVNYKDIITNERKTYKKDLYKIENMNIGELNQDLEIYK